MDSNLVIDRSDCRDSPSAEALGYFHASASRTSGD